MICYKLFHKRKDGSLGSLFINKKERLPIGKWIKARSYPTKGFSLRPGFHCTLEKYAPHLKTNTQERVWCKVQSKSIQRIERPTTQGGTWILAKKIKILEEIPNAKS